MKKTTFFLHSGISKAELWLIYMKLLTRRAGFCRLRAPMAFFLRPGCAAGPALPDAAALVLFAAWVWP
jgi:hypothetical protein